MENTLKEVQQELNTAISVHGNFTNQHEAYGVLIEEVDELFDEVKNNDYENMRKEAIQVAAVALKFIKYLDEYETL